MIRVPLFDAIAKALNVKVSPTYHLTFTEIESDCFELVFFNDKPIRWSDVIWDQPTDEAWISSITAAEIEAFKRMRHTVDAGMKG